MVENIHSFFKEAQNFVEKFNEWANTYKPNASADHICYKCGDRAEFEQLRTLFERESEFIYQSIISERPITVIKFKKALESALGPITYLELSDQKPDGSQKSGFDHIEIYPNDGSMESLADTLEKQGVHFEKVIRPHHTTFDTVIFDHFKVRLESEPLVEKIKRDEML